MNTQQDMMAIPINVAEAIIEPFFNGGTSDQHEVRNTFVLDHYEQTWHVNAIGKVEQMWDGVYAFVQGGTAGEPCLTMSRDCALDVSGYDAFVAFVGVPTWVRVQIDLTVDGIEQRVIDEAPESETSVELEGRFTGSQLSRIKTTFVLDEAPEHTTFHLKWFGLANSEDCERLVDPQSRYTPDWPGFLVAESAQAAPQIGIYFDDKELDRIRRLVKEEPFKTVFEGLRSQAEQDLEIEPEQYIGETNPGGTDRYVRVRRRHMPDLCQPTVRLAFVGLVADDPKMSRRAARMALSLTFCQTWDESTIGHLPGSIWHHRSFSQERTTKAVSLALDWAGHHMTAEAKRVIRDAIIMKGLPRLENDFLTIEYIRSMNQGIVFNVARVIGLLALLPAYPRYAARLEEAERDLHEMIGNYVHDDGGTLEGCGYWNYTFSNAIPQCYLLARYHGKSLADYATEDIRKTGEYPLAMLSVAGDGTNCLPINDGHTMPIAPLLAAAFTQLSDNPLWPAYYARCLTPDRVQPTFEHLVLHPEGFDPEEHRRKPVTQPRFVALETTGQIDSVRLDEAGRHVQLHMLSGAVEAGHYHEDKGSFILEVDDDAMLIDRGICNYGHPLTVALKMPRLHNMLTPDNPGGLQIEQPNDVPGGRVTSACERAGVMWTATDNTLAWESGIFERCIRRYVSPDPSLILIDDEAVLTTARTMTFSLHTQKSVDVEGDSIIVRGDKCSVRVIPVNWKPVGIAARTEGIDEHIDEVTAIRMGVDEAKSHRLVTAIEILPEGDEATWELSAEGDDVIGERGSKRVRLSIGSDGAAAFVTSDGTTEMAETM